MLYHRVTREIARTASATPGPRGTASRTAAPDESVPRSPARGIPHKSPADLNPVPLTQSEGKLRTLLGEHRWQQYAGDPRRRDVAELIAGAHRAGRDVDALLTTAVTSRPFEDDPLSPARSVADVLHYRLQRELSRGEPDGPATPQLPGQVADVLAHGTAPAGTGPHDPRTDPAAQQSPPAALDGRTAFRRKRQPMTTQPGNAKLSPLELLARQNAAIEALTATVELLQQQVEALQRRVDAIEGVPLPQEPPEPG